MTSKKNIMIMGASGFLGSHCVKKFHESGYKVFACANFDSDLSAVNSYISDSVRADLNNNSDILKIAEFVNENEIGSILYSIGKVNYKISAEELRLHNTSPLKSFIELIENHLIGKEIRYLFVSSAAQRGFQNKKSKEHLINENTMDFYKPLFSNYADIKRECHTIIENAVSRNNLDAVIVEPSSLVGESIGKTKTTNTGLIDKISKGCPVLSGGANYISVTKAAEGIKLALEKGRKHSSYIIAGENLNMKEFAELVKKTGFDKKLIKKQIKTTVLPYYLSLFLGIFNIVISKEQSKIASSFSHLTYNKASEELGYKHEMKDLVNAIERTLEHNAYLTH